MLEHVSQIIVMKNGTCIESGTYQELLDKDVNFANLVGESVAIEDPYVVDDLVNEINFLPVLDDHEVIDGGIDRRSLFEEVDHDADELELADLNDDSPSRSAVDSHSQHTGAVITFGETPKPPRIGPANVEANQATIHRIQAMNAHTSQSANINEFTLSRYIETRQMSVIDGYNPYQTTHHGPGLARAVERHQLTIHSLRHEDEQMLYNGVPISSRKIRKVPMRKVYRSYLRRSTGIWVSAAVIVLFALVQSVRIVSDFWLMFYVDDVLDGALQHNLDYLGVYGGLVGAFAVGLILRGYIYVWSVMQKSVSFHKRIFIVNALIMC